MSSATSKEFIMIDLNLINTVVWQESSAKKLRAMRGKLSRRELVERVRENGYEVSQQYIQLIENPALPKAPQNVSFQLLRNICQVLGRDVQELFDSPKIFSSGT
jgi:transcriptional regulator with XRE-family HTH domain